MALALFFIVKFISRLHRIAVLNRQLAAAAAAAENEISEPSAPCEPSEELKVLREIRDLIAGNKNATISSSTASSSIESSSHLITL
jgi:large-conductance mechanosensitive channel